MSSGRLWKRPNRCLMWNPVPSGLSSTDSVISPKVEAHDANEDVPWDSRSPGAR